MALSYKTLEQYEDNWVTEMGAWFPGERVVVRGVDLFEEFSSATWMEYLLFAVTGRRDKCLAQLIESIWVISCSFPEPRLWPNRIAALSGTTRSSYALGIASATAAVDATVYGLNPNARAFRFIETLKQALLESKPLDSSVLNYLKKHRAVPGFGRPLTKKDERIKPLLQRAKDLGYGDGEAVALIFEVEDVLWHSKKMRLNIAGLNAAIAYDAGLSAKEYLTLSTQAFSAGMYPPMVDAMTKPEGAFLPLRVSRVNSIGKHEQRVW